MGGGKGMYALLSRLRRRGHKNICDYAGGSTQIFAITQEWAQKYLQIRRRGHKNICKYLGRGNKYIFPQLGTYSTPDSARWSCRQRNRNEWLDLFHSCRRYCKMLVIIFCQMVQSENRLDLFHSCRLCEKDWPQSRLILLLLLRTLFIFCWPLKLGRGICKQKTQIYLFISK